MNPEPRGLPGRELSLPELRLAMRAAMQFLLDAAGFFRASDLTDSLILLAVVQANVAPIMADPALQRRYAGASDTPPDELRRPISINAVAASLRLPFETVRRRVQQMASRGVCEITPRGLVTPQRVLSGPDHLDMLAVNEQAVRALYLRLRRNNILPPPAEHPPPEPPPVRAVARISSDFVLRLAEPLVGISGNLLEGLTLIAVFDINTRSLPDHLDGVDAPGFVPDDLRVPATVRAVADRLKVPYEQTRRRLAQLEAEGRCTRSGHGYLITSQTLARPDLMEAYRASVLSLFRMFANLSELGVLRGWEADLAGGAAT